MSKHRLHPVFRFVLSCVTAGVFCADQAAGADAKSAAEELFAFRIQPMFKEKCLTCHGDDVEKMKGGFDMRTSQVFFKGGDSEKSPVMAGKPDESPLYLAVTRLHEEDWSPMPPKANDKLTAEQIAYIKEWIAGGAPWPDDQRLAELKKKGSSRWDVAGGVMVKTSGGLSEDWTNRKYKPENLWDYRPLSKPLVPGPGNPVDAFLAARTPAGLPPAPLTDRRTLIRRATYDLIGLPPTPDEVVAFVNDPLPDEQAFSKVVERLLASPHYGEKWGQHWLDVVRYADSSGFANDYERGDAWRYRDYVIRAFNHDKPYNQFIREQLAGDEIVEARRKLRDTRPVLDEGGNVIEQGEVKDSELLIATGFLRMGPWELTGMEVAKVARQRFLDDVTQSVGETFLAHAMQCAKCHDHKFDPIPTRDYYSLEAVFATTQMAERPAPFLPEENTAGFEEKEYLDERQKYYQEIQVRLDEKEEAAARKWCADRGLPYIPRVKGLRRGVPEDQLPPKSVGFTPLDYGMERISRKGLERLKWQYDRYRPIAFSVYSGLTPELKSVNAPLRMPANRMVQGELEQSSILAGGDPFSPKDKVVPGVLSAANNLAGGELKDLKIPETVEGRRLALANWIASPDNPLTPRVIMNRVWLWHFGQAIAGNPNNFGTTGKKPTHPELLDWLAATFIEKGWSLKAMHRLIMSSEAYRRASTYPDPKLLTEKDPTGISYAVFKPRRLTAEELRDSMLTVTGELNPTLGGIPVKPEINQEAALQPRQVMGTFAEAWQPSPKPEQRHRRSIYALKIRGLLDPFMEVFNSPSPDFSCERRDASTVTPQVFSLFNSQASYDRALALANRLMKETKSQPEAIRLAYQHAFNRDPKSDELQACLEHWQKMTQRHEKLFFPKTSYPREVVREAVEENTGEKFKFSEPLEVAVDFVPDLKPEDASPELRGLAEVCLVLLNANEFAYVY